MRKSELIAKEIAEDSYLIERKKPTEADQQLYLGEVSFTCPLCGKLLRTRGQKKPNKLYEIAHIFPNSPTEEQYETLRGLPRLGENSESFENKIALCKNCHAQQDYHTTKEEYLRLLSIKKHLLEISSLQEATVSLSLEKEISNVVSKVSLLDEDQLAELNYVPVRISDKFESRDALLKKKIVSNVTNYYPYIRDLFKQMENNTNFRFEVISNQVKNCFIKMDALTSDKRSIFNQMVKWLMAQTQSESIEACEAVLAFFVQNCEVFREIT